MAKNTITTMGCIYYIKWWGGVLQNKNNFTFGPTSLSSKARRVVAAKMANQIRGFFT